MRGLHNRLILIVFFCAAAAAAGASASNTNANYAVDYDAKPTLWPWRRCGNRTIGGRNCIDYSCCSHNSSCGITAAYCSPKENCQSFCWTSDGGASNVIAYFHHYGAKENNWNLTKAGADCYHWDDDKPYAGRKKFGWTAFCGPVGPQGPAACGKCVRVEHTKRNKGKRVYETLRIVDACTTNGFVLDTDVFHRLDFDGRGIKKGHMFLDYRFVECEDGEVGEEDDFNEEKARISSV